MSLIYCNNRSRVKPKRKPKAIRDAYEKLCREMGVDPSGKRRVKLLPVVKSPVVASGIYHRETTRYPSHDTNLCDTSPIEKKQYTGDKLIGYASMHKSNYIPIFNHEHAKDVAKMRRN